MNDHLDSSRVPPHDLDAEGVLVSACLLSDGCDLIRDRVRPEDCYSDANRHVLSAAYALHDAGHAVDMVSVHGWLKTHERLEQVGGAQYLTQVTQATPAIANLDQHVETVRDKAQLRELIRTCNWASSVAHGDCGGARTFVGEVEDRLANIGGDAAGAGVSTIGDAVVEAMDIVAAAAQVGGAGVTGARTGFDKLDRLTTGLHGGELFIVAGRPGMGKTSMVLNIAANMARAQKRDVKLEPSDNAAAFFSLEMPKAQIAVRLLASESRTDVSRIRSGNLRDSDWTRLTDAAAQLRHMQLWIDDTPAITLMAVRSKVKRLQTQLRRDRKGKLGLVAIDYLQLMQGRRNAGSREQEISELSRGLKRLAKELDVPVIALSQLNRSVETRNTKDKRPQLSDLRESGAIEQDADTILFVYRDEYYFKDESVDRGVAEVIIAKQRNGPTGTVRTKFTSEYTRFDNLAGEDDEPPAWAQGPDLDDFDAAADDLRGGF